MAAVLLASCGVFAQASQASPPEPISVFPAPGTPVASDTTSFSFRGIEPSELGEVEIVGSRTGPMSTTRLRHSDGQGVSLVPVGSFDPGERVRVRTDQRIRLARNGDFEVRIGRFYDNNRRRIRPQVPLSPGGLNSRPELKPPEFRVIESTPQVLPGRLLLAPKLDGLSIVDNRGRIVWFRPVGFGGKGEMVTNLSRQTLDGEPVLTYWKASVNARQTFRLTTFEILDDNYRRIARFTPGNGYNADLHELKITPRNTALVQALRGVRWDATAQGGSPGTKVLDNVIQEIDIETGAVLFEWHSLGNVDLGDSVDPLPSDGRPYDYFHANSVDDDGDSLLVSARHPNTVYRIDRDTAQIRWRLRGDGAKPETNDFRMGPGTSFGYQHDARRLADGSISIFDNGSHVGDEDQPDLPTVNAESSAMVLRLGRQDGERTATLVRRDRHPDRLVSDTQGSTQVLGEGSILAGWGSVARATEFDARGDVALDVTFDGAELSSYRAYKAPWRGFPLDRPAVASLRDGNGAKIWASWNGATQVRSWKVLTGPAPGELVEAGIYPWQNLETEMRIPESGELIQVAALDAGGGEIRRSRVLELGSKSHPIFTSVQGRAALEKRLLRRPFFPYD